MKRALLAALGSLALIAPTHVRAQTATSGIGQAVANTLSQWAYSNCRGLSGPSYEQCLMSTSQGYAALGPVALGNWFAVALALDLRPELGLGSGYTCTGFYCGGDTGGGGASDGDWVYDASCAQWKLRTDASGWLIVPSVKLAGGKPTKVNSTLYYPSPANSWGHLGASDPGAMAMVVAHFRNTAMSDKRDYIGIWSWNGSTAFYSSVSHWKNGVASGHVNDNPYNAAASQGTAALNGGYNRISWGSVTQNRDCPQTEADPTAFYYPSQTGDPYNHDYSACVVITPNTALSVTGFAYADQVAIAPGNLAQYVQGYEAINKCVLSKEFIRQLADAIRKRAYPNANPVTTTQVRTGGQDPRGTDLTQQPPSQLPAPQTNPPPPSVPGVTPTPTPTATGSSGGSVDTTHPDVADPGGGEGPLPSVPDLPSTEWFPAMNLGLGNPNCPTYSFDAFETHYVLDSHCPFIEQSRALISAFMIVLFTIAAARIVLDS